MDIVIDEKTLAGAVRCPHNQCCLDPERRNLCEVLNHYGDGVLFVKFRHRRSCAYRVEYGLRDYLCKCPVRQEIFKQHRV